MMAWARGSLARAHDLPAVVDAIGFAEGSAERPEVGHGATLAEKGVGRWNLQRGIRYQQPRADCWREHYCLGRVSRGSLDEVMSNSRSRSNKSLMDGEHKSFGAVIGAPHAARWRPR